MSAKPGAKPKARPRRPAGRKLSRRWLVAGGLLVAAVVLLVFTLRPDPLEDLAQHLRAKGYEPSVGLAGPPPGTVLQVSRRGADGTLEPIQPPQVVLWAEQCFPGKTPRSVSFPLPDRFGSRKGGLGERGALSYLPELSLRSAKSWELSLANPHLLTFAKLELSQQFSPECLDRLQSALDSGEDPAEYATVYEAVVADGMTLSIDWQAGAEAKGKAALERAARRVGKGVKIELSGEGGEKNRLRIQGPVVLGYRTASMEPKGERPANPKAGGEAS